MSIAAAGSIRNVSHTLQAKQAARKDKKKQAENELGKRLFLYTDPAPLPY